MVVNPYFHAEKGAQGAAGLARAGLPLPWEERCPGVLSVTTTQTKPHHGGDKSSLGKRVNEHKTPPKESSRVRRVCNSPREWRCTHNARASLPLLPSLPAQTLLSPGAVVSHEANAVINGILRHQRWDKIQISNIRNEDPAFVTKGDEGWQYFKASQSDTGKEFTMYF